MDKKTHLCWDCGKEIPLARVEVLLNDLGIAPDRLTCLKHSNTTKVKGIYLGENGTSDILLCDKVYNDSVRQKFREVEEEVIQDKSEDIDE